MLDCSCRANIIECSLEFECSFSEVPTGLKSIPMVESFSAAALGSNRFLKTGAPKPSFPCPAPKRSPKREGFSREEKKELWCL